MKVLRLSACLCTIILLTSGCASNTTRDSGHYELPKEYVVHVNDEEFSEQVLGGGPVLVEFWAEYCSACLKMHPVMEELGEEFEGRVKVVMVDIKTNRKWAGRYDIKLIPTYILFENGEVAAKAVGAMPMDSLTRKLGLE